jgi:hypothetical protein
MTLVVLYSDAYFWVGIRGIDAEEPDADGTKLLDERGRFVSS